MNDVGRFAIAVVLTASLAATGVACKKKAGASCEGAASMCEDKASALVCRTDKLVSVPCKGPLGCTKFEDRANCDASIADVGDACMADSEEHQACAADGKRAVVCHAGRFERFLECRGEGGCRPAGNAVACDTSLASPGDACKEPGQASCAADGKQMLVCQNGVFAVQRFCRGAGGCALKSGSPTCDASLSIPGDPCGTVGQVVCAIDGQSELICQGGSFQRGRSCRRTPCTVSNKPGRAVDCN